MQSLFNIDVFLFTAGRSVVILQHSWPQIFKHERVTLKCEIEGGGNTEWIYEWKIPSSSWRDEPGDQAVFTINYVDWSDRGDYRCQGRPKHEPQSSTGWSDAVTLTVLGKSELHHIHREHVSM